MKHLRAQLGHKYLATCEEFHPARETSLQWLICCQSDWDPNLPPSLIARLPKEPPPVLLLPS